MPRYMFRCDKCGNIEDRECPLNEKMGIQLCECGEEMVILVKKEPQMVVRRIKLRHQKWIKERGL